MAAITVQFGFCTSNALTGMPYFLQHHRILRGFAGMAYFISCRKRLPKNN
jgi:hypothetical protein